MCSLKEPQKLSPGVRSCLLWLYRTRFTQPASILYFPLLSCSPAACVLCWIVKIKTFLGSQVLLKVSETWGETGEEAGGKWLEMDRGHQTGN
jgi:hypothetical protein